MVSFSVAPEVKQRFPAAHVAFIQGMCHSNALVDEAAFQAALSEAVAKTKTIPVLAEHPPLAAWRKMYRAFGEDPTKRKPSAEALVKRMRNGESFPRVNAIVDCYNLVSLKHLVPIGGQDAERVSGAVLLRFAKEGEPFVPLGAQETQTTNAGEVVYADAEKILCRKWNYRDCEQAKIAEHTRQFVLFVDGAEGIAKEDVEATAKDLCETLSRFLDDGQASYRMVPFT